MRFRGRFHGEEDADEDAPHHEFGAQACATRDCSRRRALGQDYDPAGTAGVSRAPGGAERICQSHPCVGGGVATAAHRIEGCGHRFPGSASGVRQPCQAACRRARGKAAAGRPQQRARPEANLAALPWSEAVAFVVSISGVDCIVRRSLWLHVVGRCPNRHAIAIQRHDASPSRSPGRSDGRSRPRPESELPQSRGRRRVVIPAGFTYFGQFVDHDITLDVSSSLDAATDANTINNMRSPSLDLDCVYGRGPGLDPFLYAFPTAGTADGDQAPARHQLPSGPAVRAAPAGPGAWSTQTDLDVPRMAGTQHGDHRRPAQRREPDRRAVPPRDAAVPQRRRRHAAGGGVHRRHLRGGEADRHAPLPVGGGQRLPQSGSAAQRPWTMRWPRVSAPLGSAVPDAGRVRRRRLPLRPQHDPRHVLGELQLPQRHARPGVRVQSQSTAAGAARTGSSTSTRSSTPASPCR